MAETFYIILKECQTVAPACKCLVCHNPLDTGLSVSVATDQNQESSMVVGYCCSTHRDKKAALAQAVSGKLIYLARECSTSVDQIQIIHAD